LDFSFSYGSTSVPSSPTKKRKSDMELMRELVLEKQRRDEEIKREKEIDEQIRNHLKQNEISLDDSDESKLLMRMDKATKFVLGNNMKSKKNLYRVHVFVKPKELPKPNIQ